MSPADRALFYVNKSYVLNGKQDWQHAKITAFFIADEVQKESSKEEDNPTSRFDYWEMVKNCIVQL